MKDGSLENITVVSFESRMADEARNLIEKYGGNSISAPSMQEVPLDRHDAVFAFADRLLGGDVDVLICLTGVGTRMLIDTMISRHRQEDVFRALRSITIVARGPKPVRALKEFSLKAEVRVPEPNTWREVLESIDKGVDVSGKNVGVQEYGTSNVELIEDLERRGARVLRVPIYRWTLPDDLRPLLRGIHALVDGTAHAAVFTSHTQVDHVMDVARREGVSEDLREALRKRVVASVGPICSEGLIKHGIKVDIEPEHPKLGALIRDLAKKAPELLETKL